MKVKVFVRGVPDEVESQMGSVSVGSGKKIGIDICGIKEKRTRPVYIRLESQRGKSTALSGL